MIYLEEVRDETGVFCVLECLYNLNVKILIHVLKPYKKKYIPASRGKFPFLVDRHSTSYIIQKVICKTTRRNSPFSTFSAHNTFSIILARYVNADNTDKILMLIHEDNRKLHTHASSSTRSMTLDGLPLDIARGRGRLVILNFYLAYLYMMYTGIKYLDALLTLFISSSDASTLIKITFYEQSDRLDK